MVALFGVLVGQGLGPLLVGALSDALAGCWHLSSATTTAPR